MRERFPLLAAGLLGATGVLLGATGTHVLSGILLARGHKDMWETAVLYQLVHAVALLGLAGWLKPLPHGVAAHRSAMAVRFWVAGTVLFAGSLYLFALGGPRVLMWLTPFGGLSLIVGWAYAAGTAMAPRSEHDL